MKLVLILITLVAFSTSTFSAELYCKSKAGVKSKLPDPKVIAPEEYKAFTKFLADRYNILSVDSCVVEQSPELYKLYKDISETKYDSSKSNFETSAYAIKFIEGQKPKFDLEWSMFDNPFELIAFPTWLSRNKPSALTYGKIPKEYMAPLLKEYREVLYRKTLARELEAADLKMKLAEEKRLQEEKKVEEEAQELEVFYDFKDYSYDLTHYSYMTLIIEKGESALKEVDAFIQKRLADNVDDFYKKLVIACYSMSCDEKSKSAYVGAVKNNLNFKIYEEQSVLAILILQNRVSEVRDFLKKYPDYKISDAEFYRSAHIDDLKIYNFLKYEKGLKIKPSQKNMDRYVLQHSIDSNGLSDLIIENLSGTKERKQMATYFFAKHPAFKAKHMLGYAIFDVTPPSAEAFAVAKKKDVKLPEYDIRDYAFEEPNWNSKRILVRTKEGKISPEFKRESFFQVKEAIEFDEIRNQWIGFQAGKTRYWMYRSTVKDLMFVDKVIGQWALVKSVDAAYSDAGGKKIEGINFVGLENRAYVLRSKWIDNELWLNVNFMKSPCSKKLKKELFDVWIKPFNTEGKNTVSFPTGC